MNTTFHKTDAEIETQIREELHWDCRTEGASINVSVNEGVVKLTGKVKSYAFKRTAEEATHRIAGVQSVSNEIVVKVPYIDFKADWEIAAAATNLFHWNVFIPHEKITVEVYKGWISLFGTVNCWSEREEAERCVGQLAGVCGVTNAIRVNVPTVEPEAICKAISATLERHSREEAQHVRVEMNDGRVRLSGDVPTWGERCVVVHAAGYAPGVRQVVDELKVTAEV